VVQRGEELNGSFVCSNVTISKNIYQILPTNISKNIYQIPSTNISKNIYQIPSTKIPQTYTFHKLTPFTQKTYFSLHFFHFKKSFLFIFSFFFYPPNLILYHLLILPLTFLSPIPLIHPPPFN